MNVKNVSRGPQYVEGPGVLEAGDTGRAVASDHTDALIDSGALIEMPAAKTTTGKDKD